MSKMKHLIAAAVVLTTMAGTAVPAFADTSSPINNVTGTNNTGNTTNGTGSTSPAAYPAIYLSFVTQVTQSISVALASNDVDKAKLLVQFGIDNIKQANELIAEGNTDAANALLTTALTQQDLAVDAGSQSGGTTATEVKGEVAGNLQALAEALQNVSNPTAQAALRKNIEKGFEHLQKRIGKIKVTPTSTTGNQGTVGSTSADAGSSASNTTSGSVTDQNTTGSVNVTVGNNNTDEDGGTPAPSSGSDHGNGNGHSNGDGHGQGNGNGHGHH